MATGQHRSLRPLPGAGGCGTTARPRAGTCDRPTDQTPAVLEILSGCGGPTGIHAARRHELTAITTAHTPRIGDKLVTAILAALDQQAVVVPGTSATDTMLPRLADSLKTVLQQRKQVAAEVEEILDAPPRAGVLT